jgi:hypothetical protein
MKKKYKKKSADLPHLVAIRHDAGSFRSNGVSRRTLNGMKPLNPRCFGVRGVIGKKSEVQKPNRVSAIYKYVIATIAAK